MCNWVAISRNHYAVDSNCCFESLPERVGKNQGWRLTTWKL